MCASDSLSAAAKDIVAPDRGGFAGSWSFAAPIAVAASRGGGVPTCACCFLVRWRRWRWTGRDGGPQWGGRLSSGASGGEHDAHAGLFFAGRACSGAASRGRQEGIFRGRKASLPNGDSFSFLFFFSSSFLLFFSLRVPVPPGKTNKRARHERGREREAPRKSHPASRRLLSVLSVLSVLSFGLVVFWASAGCACLRARRTSAKITCGQGAELPIRQPLRPARWSPSEVLEGIFSFLASCPIQACMHGWVRGWICAAVLAELGLGLGGWKPDGPAALRSHAVPCRCVRCGTVAVGTQRRMLPSWPRCGMPRTASESTHVHGAPTSARDQARRLRFSLFASRAAPRAAPRRLWSSTLTDADRRQSLALLRQSHPCPN